MAILLTRRWSSQPNGPVELAWDNPLSNGLVFLVNQQQLVVQPAGATVTTAGNWSARSHRGSVAGSSVDYDGATSVILNVSVVPNSPAAATLFCLAGPDAPSLDRTAIALGQTGSNNTILRIGFNTSGQPNFQVRNDAAGGPAVITKTGGSGIRSCVGIYRQSTEAKEFYVNASLVGSDSTASGPLTLNRTAVGALVRTSTSAWHDGVIPLAGIWNRALSVSEIWQLYENPWQLFRYPRSKWFVALSAETADAAVTLTGVSAAATVGTLDAQVTETETLGELTAGSAVGDLTAIATSDAEVTLTEVAAAAAVADLTAEIVSDALDVTLTGVSAAAAVDTLSVTADTADSVSLAGVSASSAVGDLEALSTDVLAETLSGVSAEGTLEDLIATTADADALTPVAAQGEVGTLTADATEEYSAALIGLDAAGAVGDLTSDLSLQFEIELVGVSATGTVRDLRIPDDQDFLEEDIKNALKHLVKGRVYPLRRPQRESQQIATANLPEIVYTIVSDDWQQAETLCGVGLHNTRVQLDVYAGHYREARAFAYAAAEQMDTLGWRINMQPFPDDDEKIYRWQLEYSCWRNEAPPSLPLISTHRG